MNLNRPERTMTIPPMKHLGPMPIAHPYRAIGVVTSRRLTLDMVVVVVVVVIIHGPKRSEHPMAGEGQRQMRYRCTIMINDSQPEPMQINR